MPHKNKEEKKAYHRDYYKRLKGGEIIGRGTRPVRNIIGMKFGCLAAVRFSHREGFLKRPFWEFLCDCGNTKIIAAADVISGKTKSCGCLPRGRSGPRIGSGEAAFNNLFCAYKGNAKSRGLEFTLSKAEFRTLTKDNCVYCGVEPQKLWLGTNKKCSPYIYNGIDRVKNEQGYVISNTVSCCQVCNQAKHNMKLDDFIAWLDRVVKFRNTESDAISIGEK